MKNGAKPRRVGLVIGQLSYGGAESQLYELARRLPPGYRPVVYCLSSRVEPFGGRLREKGIAVRVIRSRGHYDWSRAWRLARSLRADEIEVVHAFLFIASAYAYLATRCLRGARLISSARNCKIEPNPWRRWLLRKAFAASDAVLCNSAEMARFAARHYGLRQEAARVVYNGVDTDRFAFSAKRPEQLTIGTVGRLERQKNLTMFLDAAVRVRSSVPGARFEIIGEGSQRDRLEEEIRARGLADCVRLPGTLADIPEFLRGLSQFWLTSDWEGTPNVVLEAMATGLPVLCTRVGGVAELIEDGRDGLLLDAGDAAGLAEQSLRLHAQPEAADQIGRDARRAVEQRFSMAAMVAATMNVYEEAVRSRP